MKPSPPTATPTADTAPTDWFHEGSFEASYLRDVLVSGHLADRQEMTGLQTAAGLTSARLSSYSKFTRLLLQSLALGVGALLAISASISPGAIFASMFIVGRALAPIDQLVGGWRTVIQARGSIETLDELFATTPPDIARTLLPEPEGRLDVDGVTVMGVQGQRPILHNVRFSVAPGEVLAIIGPSGAGKSTLVRTIAGALRPSAGLIRFDGAEQRDCVMLRFIQGFSVSENPAFGGVHGGHSKTGWHYRGGAIDVNWPNGQRQSAEETAKINAIVGLAKGYGLRTLWQWKGHYDHAHFDIDKGPDLGNFAGAGGGAGTLICAIHLSPSIGDYWVDAGISDVTVRGQRADGLGRAAGALRKAARLFCAPLPLIIVSPLRISLVPAARAS